MEAHVNDDIPVGTYLDTVATLNYAPVGKAVWRVILDEGLDEEQDLPCPEDWAFAVLGISGTDRQGLIAMTDEAIEKFNAFDIALKERYGGKVIDLVDYDRGVVRLVCQAGFDFVDQPKAMRTAR